jgi:hypothetical protein
MLTGCTDPEGWAATGPPRPLADTTEPEPLAAAHAAKAPMESLGRTTPKRGTRARASNRPPTELDSAQR